MARSLTQRAGFPFHWPPGTGPGYVNREEILRTAFSDALMFVCTGEQGLTPGRRAGSMLPRPFIQTVEQSGRVVEYWGPGLQDGVYVKA